MIQFLLAAPRSGSGKTTLALRLKERFGEDEVRLISHDRLLQASRRAAL